jgi:surfeit locus 1 family protein
VLLSLGSWQLYRLNWKLNLLSEIENSLKNNPVELSKSNKKNYLRIKTSGILILINKFIYII